MAPNYRDDAGHNAPEVNEQQQSYLYSVPADEAPNYSSPPTTKAYYHAGHVEPESPLPATPRKGGGWKRWWVLALIGLFIALISGLVGGFIGQAIQKGLESGASATATATGTGASPSPSSAPSNGSSTAITPPPRTAEGTIGTIVVPNTGCNFPSSRERRRISNSTVYSRTSYTTICNSGWGGAGTDILAIWTLTPSDCIEACLQYNSRPENDRPCVGGGFIPAWTNQSVAVTTLNGPPFNCYLKNSSIGISANDREIANVEVVSLCLDGKCNGIGTSGS